MEFWLQCVDIFNDIFNLDFEFIDSSKLILQHSLVLLAKVLPDSLEFKPHDCKNLYLSKLICFNVQFSHWLLRSFDVLDCFCGCVKCFSHILWQFDFMFVLFFFEIVFNLSFEVHGNIHDLPALSTDLNERQGELDCATNLCDCTTESKEMYFSQQKSRLLIGHSRIYQMAQKELFFNQWITSLHFMP